MWYLLRYNKWANRKDSIISEPRTKQNLIKILSLKTTRNKTSNRVIVCTPMLFLNLPTYKYSRLYFNLTRSEYIHVFFQQKI